MPNKKFVRLSHPIKTMSYGTSNGDQNRLILIDESKMMGHDDGSKQHNIWMQKNDTIIDCFICLFVYGFPTTSGTVRNSAQQ